MKEVKKRTRLTKEEAEKKFAEDLEYFLTILNGHRGKKRAILVPEIQLRLGYPVKFGDTYKTRHIAKRAIVEYGALVGSCDRGYYQIETEEELVETISFMLHNSNGTLHRAECLDKNWEAVHGKRRQIFTDQRRGREIAAYVQGRPTPEQLYSPRNGRYWEWEEFPYPYMP